MFHVLWLSAVYFLESLWIATKGYQYRVDWAYAEDIRGAPCQMLKKWRLLLSSYFLLNTSGDNNQAVQQGKISILGDQKAVTLDRTIFSATLQITEVKEIWQ